MSRTTTFTAILFKTYNDFGYRLKNKQKQINKKCILIGIFIYLIKRQTLKVSANEILINIATVFSYSLNFLIKKTPLFCSLDYYFLHISTHDMGKYLLIPRAVVLKCGWKYLVIKMREYLLPFLKFLRFFWVNKRKQRLSCIDKGLSR